MNNVKKIFKSILSFTMIWISCLPVQAQVEAKTDTKEFLSWYEENKNKNRATFDLQGDLHLDKPYVLDGLGSLDIDCGIYSIYIEDTIVIDNPNLMIMSNWKSPSATVILRNTEQAKSVLHLKNGGIYGSTTALHILSGEFIAPQGNDRFSIVAGRDTMPAIQVSTANVILQNLEIEASGTSSVIAVSANQDIELQDCTVLAKAESVNASVIGVQAERAITLKNTTIKALGDNAQSVISNAGTSFVKADETSILSPRLLLAPQSVPNYQITKRDQPQINVPIHMSNVLLPDGVDCQLTNWKDPTQVITKRLQVNWDIEDLAFYLQEFGEYTITGSFSQTQLDEEGIYLQDSFQPKITLKVVPYDAMNKLNFTKIESGASYPYIETHILRPYGAEKLSIEYSKDGLHWERGLCKAAITSAMVDNMLECDQTTSSYILMPVYFSSLVYHSQIRAVVQGGPFDGIHNSVYLDEENLLVEDDGKGGNRGGSGQWEGKRGQRDNDDTSGLANPNNIIQNTGVETTTFSLHYYLLPLFVCFLVFHVKKKRHS